MLPQHRQGVQWVPTAWLKNYPTVPWEDVPQEIRALLTQAIYSTSNNPGVAYTIVIALTRLKVPSPTILDILGLWCASGYTRSKLEKMLSFGCTWAMHEAGSELTQAAGLDTLNLRAYEAYKHLFTTARSAEPFTLSASEITAELETATKKKWHRTQVDRVLEELVTKGFLTKLPKQGKRNTYRFLTPVEREV